MSSATAMARLKRIADAETELVPLKFAAVESARARGITWRKIAEILATERSAIAHWHKRQLDRRG